MVNGAKKEGWRILLAFSVRQDVRADVQRSDLCTGDPSVPSTRDVKSQDKKPRLGLRISIQDLKKRKEPSHKGDSSRGGSHLPSSSVFPIVNQPLNLQNAKVSTSGFGIRAFLRRLTGGQPATQFTKTANPTPQVSDGVPIHREMGKNLLEKSAEELSSKSKDDQVNLDPCSIPLPPSPKSAKGLSFQSKDDQVNLDPCSIPLPPSPKSAKGLSFQSKDDQVNLDPCSIPLPPSPTFSLINLPTISSSAESQENEQIRPSSEKAEPEGNQSPDQHASPAANDLQTLQTSESDGKSPQSPLMLITSAWTIQETCTPLDRSPTLSPIDDEIIVSPVGSQDSKAGLMVDRIDIQEYVGLDGKVQQPGYSRSRSASPEFQMAEMGFSGEKRGNNKSWRRSMANLSEVLSFLCPNG
ncbi:Hypothetical Protein CGB_K2070C [Cryptococcus gattii WM276]|uniref:Uncharacterized protein n=1 Tax=Cryptococcus gattii serotype B (strain WM276 / ATCC MYA-4071) TaxID=367775 RepID=E6RDI2_CRYGW|nr:Hypothetical Protein CGB_K2070C [Cryptococcus gattii WM276]ADV24949.1 Hypothetical Protein CGB_K2070C [Cryptococcus gattii WM276]KJE05756.1 hypothetical protein I311_00481 [Cryptococcus gattii NT-10]